LRWWDLSVEPGWIQDRGYWSLAELRARPNRNTSAFAAIETLYGGGIVDDQHILVAKLRSHHDGIEWVHEGILPNHGDVVTILSDDNLARSWRIYDFHHHLRLGNDSAALRFHGWSGRLRGGDTGVDHQLSTAVLVSTARRWGGASLDLGLAPMPMMRSAPPTPTADAMIHAAERFLPYLGVRASAGLRGAALLENGRWVPTPRFAARIEGYSLLDNGRGTRLKPRLSLRIQRVRGGLGPINLSLLGVSGEVVSVGMKASQAGFIHDYEMLAIARRDHATVKRAVLGLWRGLWVRRSWSVSGRLIMDSTELEPAMFSANYIWRDPARRRHLEFGYLRRHLGRDLSVDPDPWLGVNQQPYWESVPGSVYSVAYQRFRWRSERWALAATTSVRPVPWSLISVRLEAGYSSRCNCWGVLASGGYAGDIRPGVLEATPFFGLSFHSGRSPQSISRALGGAAARLNR
jgi:hypothetical protein